MKCLFLVEEIVASHHVFMMFFFYRHLSGFGRSNFQKIIPCLVLNMKLPSLKTKIAPENRHPLVFQPSIFRCYVSFRDCRYMSDSFHPPRLPWKMSGFQITLCRTQLDFDAHFALKGCFHTFSRRWAVAKYFPQRPKGNRNLVP